MEFLRVLPGVNAQQLARCADELKKAESELKLLHMGGGHRRNAYMHIEKARIALKLLSGWCDG